MSLDNLNIGIYKLKDFMNYIKVKRNNLLNSLYSSVSLDFLYKETPYVNFFTDTELSSSLYAVVWLHLTKVILCVQEHAVMFVQLYANPSIGERIVSIKK